MLIILSVATNRFGLRIRTLYRAFDLGSLPQVLSHIPNSVSMGCHREVALQGPKLVLSASNWLAKTLALPAPAMALGALDDNELCFFTGTAQAGTYTMQCSESFELDCEAVTGCISAGKHGRS
jgi:hypothetical protein